MPEKRKRADFTRWLQSQLKALRARRFEQLDVAALGDELEGALGRYHGAVRTRAERLISILMNPAYVYGDWNDLRMEWGLLQEALRDSPSLRKTASAQICRAYQTARLHASLHCEGEWPVKCPWPTVEALCRAVRARNRKYIALERKGNPDFVNLRRPVADVVE